STTLTWWGSVVRSHSRLPDSCEHLRAVSAPRKKPSEESRRCAPRCAGVTRRAALPDAVSGRRLGVEPQADPAQLLDLVAEPRRFLEFEVARVPIHLLLELLHLREHVGGAQLLDRAA